MDVLNVVVAAIRSLDLEKRLSPRTNPDIAWFYVFLPAFVGYIIFLAHFLNSHEQIGSIDVYNASLATLIDPQARIEVLVSGVGWAEGPLWVEDASISSNYLLFSETVPNKISKWEEGRGLFTVGKTRLYENSGCKVSPQEYCRSLAEPGSNCLLTTLHKHYTSIVSTVPVELIVCQHGDRALSIFHENGTRTVVADNFRGRQFNSPNDAVWSPEGHLYFTDPPYGLINNETKKITDRQLPFSGIYMIKAEAIREVLRTGQKVDGEKDIRLLHKDMRRPNGLAFSPDYSKLYVANSERADAYWRVFDVTDSGGLANGKVFYNLSDSDYATTLQDSERGQPDGLKVDIFGNLFAAAPGGILIFSGDGDLLGRINLDTCGKSKQCSAQNGKGLDSRMVTNLGFGNNGILYITAEDIVASVVTKTRPARLIN
jgi:gluconolactonase